MYEWDNWEWDLIINMKLIYVSYVSYTYSLCIILWDVLKKSVHETKFVFINM